MATFEKRGDLQWRAKIRAKGWPTQSKTFTYKKDAERWAKEIELEIERGVFNDLTNADNLSLHDAFTRYLKEVTPKKKGAKREKNRIERWQNHKLAKVAIANIRPSNMAEFRDQLRSEGKAENTIRLELSLLSSLFETARKEWSLNVQNPVKQIKLPKGSNSRERRLEYHEEEYLIKGIKKVAKNKAFSMIKLIQLELETGMRQGELLRLEWIDVDIRKSLVHVTEAKSGDPRDVPLSIKAIETIQELRQENSFGKIFSMTQDQIIRKFQKACEQGRALYKIDYPKQLDIKFLSDLKFHDLRHEAASRIADKLEAHELAKMFGWKTMQMALRYYHPRAENLAKKLG